MRERLRELWLAALTVMVFWGVVPRTTYTQTPIATISTNSNPFITTAILPVEGQVPIANNASEMSGRTVMLADGAIPRAVTNLFTYNRGVNPPFAVAASAGVVANLDADKLDGQQGTYYLNASNLTSGTVPMARLATSGTCDATSFLRGDSTCQAVTGPPSGTIQMYGGFTAPSGWMFCDGSTISRTTFSALLAVVTVAQNGTRTGGSAIVTALTSTTNLAAGEKVEGTGIPAGATVLTVDSATQITLSANASSTGTSTVTAFPWGSGDGATTFNVPDFRSRSPLGVGTGIGLTARAPGVFIGEETHLLTIAEMPAHTHPGVASSITLTSPFTGSTANYIASPTGASTGSAGGGTSHNNMQPSIAVNFIIKS